MWRRWIPDRHKGPCSRYPSWIRFHNISHVDESLYRRVWKVRKHNLSLITKPTAPMDSHCLNTSALVFLTSLDEEGEAKIFVSPGFLLSKASGLNHGSRASFPAEHQWLVTHDNTAGPRLTEEMPELKSCFHGNRLSSSQHCITPEPLSFCQGCDKCSVLETEMEGLAEEKREEQ